MASAPAPVSDAPSSRRDAELAVAEAHHQWLRRVFDAEFNFVWRFLRRLGLDPTDADDGAQQVFMVIAKAQERIVPGKERAFLCGTAVRVASDARRRKQRCREVACDPPEGPTSAPLPDVLADRRQARALLDQVLSELREELRTVFVLYELEELSSREIGAALGLPRGTVASRLRKARAEFQAIIRRKRARGEIPGGDR